MKRSSLASDLRMNNSLYLQVRAGFVIKNTSFNAWCKKNNVLRPNAHKALIGEWKGPKARELVAKITSAAGLKCHRTKTATAALEIRKKDTPPTRQPLAKLTKNYPYSYFLVLAETLSTAMRQDQDIAVIAEFILNPVSNASYEDCLAEKLQLLQKHNHRLLDELMLLTWSPKDQLRPLAERAHSLHIIS